MKPRSSSQTGFSPWIHFDLLVDLIKKRFLVKHITYLCCCCSRILHKKAKVKRIWLYILHCMDGQSWNCKMVTHYTDLLYIFLLLCPFSALKSKCCPLYLFHYQYKNDWAWWHFQDFKISPSGLYIEFSKFTHPWYHEKFFMRFITIPWSFSFPLMLFKITIIIITTIIIINFITCQSDCLGKWLHPLTNVEEATKSYSLNKSLS